LTCLRIKISRCVIAVCITTRLRAGRPINWGSIPDTVKRLYALQFTQTISVAQPVSYSFGIGKAFMWRKTVNAYMGIEQRLLIHCCDILEEQRPHMGYTVMGILIF
jgi:hypothetical protein